LVLVLWLVGWELVGSGAIGGEWFGIPVASWSIAMSPWQAIQAAAQPVFASGTTRLWFESVTWYLISALAASVMLNAVAIAMVRVWNPSREAQAVETKERDRADRRGQTILAGSTPTDVHSAGGKVRQVWDNPILWREICTWAYGKKVLLVRLGYWVVFGLCVAGVVRSSDEFGGGSGPLASAAQAATALLVVSLILLNAATVTSLTNERDGRALDLLLVTDLSPSEIVCGKLGGAFYNAKEMIVLPLGLFFYLWYVERLSTGQAVFLLGGWLVLCTFAAVLGLHAGITYANSRTAIATSIGTLLFLFLGVATCMRIMLAFSHSFQYQLTSFLGFIAGGSVGLFVALGWRNPSTAIFWASLVAPFATFFVITSYLLGDYDYVFIVTVATYGFATAAMLVPAVSEFDVALGRTVMKDE
jgi:hypothetical protein